MSIEGILQAEPLRDYLYATMRGAAAETPESFASQGNLTAESPEDEGLTLLREIRNALVRLADHRDPA